MKILGVRSSIYDQFHGSDCGMKHFLKPENADSYAAYYTAMYIIQNTGEAVSAHMTAGFSKDPMRAYLEFWGVMQAIVMQQDAICELHEAVVGKSAEVIRGDAWWAIRHKRDLCVGHPAKRSRGVPANQRTFMGRLFGDYDRIRYELWDAKMRQTTHPVFNLRKLVTDYDKEASQILQSVLDDMVIRWPLRRS
jgi:hypothetical protein